MRMTSKEIVAKINEKLDWDTLSWSKCVDHLLDLVDDKEERIVPMPPIVPAAYPTIAEAVEASLNGLYYAATDHFATDTRGDLKPEAFKAIRRLALDARSVFNPNWIDRLMNLKLGRRFVLEAELTEKAFEAFEDAAEWLESSHKPMPDPVFVLLISDDMAEETIEAIKYYVASPRVAFVRFDPSA